MPASPVDNGHSQAAANSTTNCTFTITTSGAGIILALMSYAQSGGSGAHVNSVTASGLTFTAVPGAAIEQASGTSNYSRSEVWIAQSAGAVSGLSVTSTWNNSGDLSMMLLGVSGCDATTPIDPNANAIQTAAVNVSGPSVVISTDNADDLLVEYGGAAGNHPGTDVSTGFTQIQHFNNGGRIFGFLNTKSVSAVQSGVTVSGISSGLDCYVLLALTADASSTDINASLAETFDDFTLSSSADVDDAAALAATFGDFTLAATAATADNAALAETFGDFTLSASAWASFLSASMFQGFGDFTLAATMAVERDAALAETFDDFTLASIAFSGFLTASLAVTFDNFVLHNITGLELNAAQPVRVLLG